MAKKKAKKKAKARKPVGTHIENCTFTMTAVPEKHEAMENLTEAILVNAEAALAVAKLYRGSSINLAAINVGHD